MNFIECTQGSAEWLQARAGAITASCFEEAISVLQRDSGKRKKGEPTAAADKYAGDLAIERISSKPYGEPPKAWVLERGHTMEALARVAYETRNGLMAMEAGVCKTDDGWFGYSTDGLVDADGLIEIKCPIASDKIIDMLTTGDTSEYDHQMQGGMWITGRKWCDFIMYVPDLESVGRDLFVKRIYRDDEFIEAMEQKLLAFRDKVMATEAFFRSDAQAIGTRSLAETAVAAAIRAEQEAIERPIAQAPIPGGQDEFDNWRQGGSSLPITMHEPEPTIPSGPPTLQLGQINEHLLPAMKTSVEGLRSLGFEPAGRDRAAMLYHVEDLPRIIDALISQLQRVRIKLPI